MLGQNFAATFVTTPQRQALIALYNSTQGDGWTEQLRLEDLAPLSRRFCHAGHGEHMVRPDRRIRHPDVAGIDLTGNNLVGTIPAEIGILTTLRNLYLDNGRLTGPIPLEIGSLTRLYHLGLSDNQLSGSIPAALGSLSDLGYLYLNTNRLSGSIPVELCSLTNLRQLFLYSNELSG